MRRNRLFRQQTEIELKIEGDSIAVITPYDEEFVRLLKSSIPVNERRWDKDNARWLVSPKNGQVVQDLCKRCFNESPKIPQVHAGLSLSQRVLEVRYIGLARDRGDGNNYAFGWSDGGWNIIFPENVLRIWFDSPSTPDQLSTLYAVLNVSRTATEEEIKKGYWRMSKQWHPDICHEPNAAEQYLVIQEAYKVLKNNREKYDAGLDFEDSIRNFSDHGKSKYNYKLDKGYRSPLRCGMVKCNGTSSVGLFNVIEILSWDDIKNDQGLTLVVSWQTGATHFSEVWC